jgi:hypothetical protein
MCVWGEETSYESDLPHPKLARRGVYKKANLAFSAYTPDINADDQMYLIFLCSELPTGLLYFCVKLLSSRIQLYGL